MPKLYDHHKYKRGRRSVATCVRCGTKRKYRQVGDAAARAFYLVPGAPGWTLQRVSCGDVESKS